jgi:RND family efflux transporter MFP subunit
MKKNIIQLMISAGIIVSLSVFLQACTESKGSGKTIPKSTDPIPVKVVSLEMSTANAAITTSGQVTTDDETILGFKTGGVVDKVFVQAGDAVKKGQLLARLDPTEINALVSQARLGLEKAQRDFQRVQNLYRDSVATLEQLQNVETGVAIAKEQFEAAQFNRSHSEIHAQANGHVLKKFVNAGQVVGVGDPILLTNGGGKGGWILRAGISDKQWATIKAGDKGTVKIDAFPENTFRARVIRKSETSDPQTGAFTVELAIESGNEKLASGMFGAVQINSGEAQTSWSVPYEAVLDANDNEGFVFITNDQKTAVRQPVVIESFNGTHIRISKGLENATTLIVSGSAYLKDQSPIHIVK